MDDIGWSSLPSDLALITDARRRPAPSTGAGTARKLELVRGVVALDSDEARLTEFRRRFDGSGEVSDDSGCSTVVDVARSLALRSAADGSLSARTTSAVSGTHFTGGVRVDGGRAASPANDEARLNRWRDDTAAAAAD